jgi:hypothetical protein
MVEKEKVISDHQQSWGIRMAPGGAVAISVGDH